MKTLSVFILALILGAYTAAFAQQWTPLGAGITLYDTDQSVVDRLVEIDGKLYACGYFNTAGSVTAWSIAYWNGDNWNTHGIGVDSEVAVLDVAKYNGFIVAFFTWGGEELINYWDGAAWTKFPAEGLGTANIYTDAQMHNDELYLLQDAEGVYKYNGDTWDKLSGSDKLGIPRVLASYKNDLYVGTDNGLYKYSGSQFQKVWSNANIFGLKTIDNTLYMTGGYLGVANASDTMTGVAAFDGTNVTSLGKPFPVDTTEFSEYINDVAKVGNRLVAGGDVHHETFGESKILVYENGTWNSIGVADDVVRSVVAIGNTVYVGGYFHYITQQPFSNVAAINLTNITPGIRGQVYLDLDHNCLPGPNDKRLGGHIIRAMPGPYYASTAADGSYVLFVGPGTFTVTAAPLTYANYCSPESYTITDTASGVDFGFKSIDDSARVQPYLAAGRYVAGRLNTIVILATNLSGVVATNVSVRLQLSPNLNFLSSDHSYQQTGPQEYTFTIPSIPPRDYERIIVLDSVDVGTVGEYAHVRVFSFVGGSFGEDEDMALILSPHDPNEKLVASQLEGAPYVTQDTIEADDMLTYKINFQNVGTDTAYQVIIRDTISPLLDLLTFQTLASTHPYKVDVGSNFITWTFDDIKLPDSSANQLESNGSLRYQIKQITGNTPGTVITNSAAIYFDFNAPVITNETRNIIALPSSVEQHEGILALTIAPNPAQATIAISVGYPAETARVVIYSVVGKEVYSTSTSLPASIALRSYERGMYTVEVTLANGLTYRGKLILE